MTCIETEEKYKNLIPELPTDFEIMDMDLIINKSSQKDRHDTENTEKPQTKKKNNKDKHDKDDNLYTVIFCLFGESGRVDC